MKTLLLILSLFGSFLISPLASAGGKIAKTKPEVKVIVHEDDINNPDNWQPEITVVSIKSYGDLEKVKFASWRKKEARDLASFRRKESVTLAIFRKYMKEEYEALQKLRAEDTAAAMYWLEIRAGYLSYDEKEFLKEPTSKAYMTFKDVLADLERRSAPENQEAEEAYSTALKRANEIYDAEVVKAQELFDAAQQPKT